MISLEAIKDKLLIYKETELAAATTAFVIGYENREELTNTLIIENENRTGYIVALFESDGKKHTFESIHNKNRITIEYRIYFEDNLGVKAEVLKGAYRQ